MRSENRRTRVEAAFVLASLVGALALCTLWAPTGWSLWYLYGAALVYGLGVAAAAYKVDAWLDEKELEDYWDETEREPLPTEPLVEPVVTWEVDGEVTNEPPVQWSDDGLWWSITTDITDSRKYVHYTLITPRGEAVNV